MVQMPDSKPWTCICNITLYNYLIVILLSTKYMLSAFDVKLLHVLSHCCPYLWWCTGCVEASHLLSIKHKRPSGWLMPSRQIALQFTLHDDLLFCYQEFCSSFSFKLHNWLVKGGYTLHDPSPGITLFYFGLRAMFDHENAWSDKGNDKQKAKIPWGNFKVDVQQKQLMWFDFETRGKENGENFLWMSRLEQYGLFVLQKDIPCLVLCCILLPGFLPQYCLFFLLSDWL